MHVKLHFHLPANFDLESVSDYPDIVLGHMQALHPELMTDVERYDYSKKHMVKHPNITVSNETTFLPFQDSLEENGAYNLAKQIRKNTEYGDHLNVVFTDPSYLPFVGSHFQICFEFGMSPVLFVPHTPGDDYRLEIRNREVLESLANAIAVYDRVMHSQGPEGWDDVKVPKNTGVVSADGYIFNAYDLYPVLGSKSHVFKSSNGRFLAHIPKYGQATINQEEFHKDCLSREPLVNPFARPSGNGQPMSFQTITDPSTGLPFERFHPAPESETDGCVISVPSCDTGTVRIPPSLESFVEGALEQKKPVLVIAETGRVNKVVMDGVQSNLLIPGRAVRSFIAHAVLAKSIYYCEQDTRLSLPTVIGDLSTISDHSAAAPGYFGAFNERRAELT